MVEGITVTTRKTTQDSPRTFEVEPKSNSAEIANAVKTGKLKINVLHNGQEKSFPVQFVKRAGMYKKVFLVDENDEEIAYALYSIDQKTNTIQISKKTIDSYQKQGISQALLAALYELIKADQHFSQYQKQNVLGDIEPTNASSIFSKVKTPNLTKGGYYKINALNAQELRDLEIAIANQKVNLPRITIGSNLTREVAQPETAKLTQLLDILKPALRGKT